MIMTSKLRGKVIGVSLMLIVMFFLGLGIQFAKASELNFSVKAIIPDNQIDKQQTYFDLRMEPKQKQTLEVLMENATKEDVTVIPQVNTAITNNNGIIDYSQVDAEKDETLTINIEDIIKTEKEVTIPAESSKVLKLNVEMPDTEFDGILLGGIHFQEKEDEKKEKEDDTQIKNKFAYIIGIQMSMNDQEIAPKLELNEVKATQVNFRNAVTANLQNTEATIVKPLSVDAKIYKEKGDEVLFEAAREDLRMAPNSNFDYAINWEDQEFKAGKYRIELTATDEEEIWEWTEYFTIESDEAKEYNEAAVDLEKDYTLWYVIIGAIVILILLFIVYRLGARKNQE